jgi:hypothetical protein
MDAVIALQEENRDRFTELIARTEDLKVLLIPESLTEKYKNYIEAPNGNKSLIIRITPDEGELRIPELDDAEQVVHL